MQNPVDEVGAAVSLLTAAVSPEIQKAAFSKYFAPDAGFRHPMCHVAPGPGSRDRILAIFQWYRIMSPNLKITTNSVVHDSANNTLLLDVVQEFHIRLSPFKPAPSRLLVRLTLREVNGLQYIAFQEDFYHPDDFMALIVPPLAPVIRMGLSVASSASAIYARIGQLLGFWTTSGLHETNRAGLGQQKGGTRDNRAQGKGAGGPPTGVTSPGRRTGGGPPPNAERQSSAAGGPPLSHGGGPMRGSQGGTGGPAIFAADVPAIIPPRLSDVSHDQLIKSFSTVSADPDRPLRPGYGTVGKPIRLRANFFPVRIPAGPIFDYAVEITPPTNINRVKARIFSLLEQRDACKPFLHHIAHDRSRRLISAKELPQPLRISVPFYEDGETGLKEGATVYTVEIVFDKELDVASLTKHLNGDIESRNYNILPIISALNLVLQQHATRTGVVVGKNKHFFPSSSLPSGGLSLGIVAFQGYYASARITYKELMVNVNNCMTPFIEPGNLGAALREVQSQHIRRNAYLTKGLTSRFTKSLRVTTTYLGSKRQKPLKATASTSASETFFKCEEFGRISVEKYFLKKYGIELEHPDDLPVVDIGGAKKTVYVPAELCEIEWQPFRGKLSDSETAQMIKYACNPPRFNAEAITTKGFPILGLNPAEAPINGFNIKIDPEMAVIPARELNPPSLTYSSGSASARNGSWNIMKVKLHRGAVVTNWAVLIVRDGREMLKGPGDERLKNLVTKIREKLQNSGLTISDDLPKLLMTRPLQNLPQDASREAALREIRTVITDAIAAAGNKKPDFILVLLSNRDNYIYPGIKAYIGFHTIHMQLSKALGEERKQDQYLSNIWQVSPQKSLFVHLPVCIVSLKVNTKLGGINHLLDSNAMKWLTKQKTMMVGIDVTHPGPGSREGAPSIAAVVASVDDNFVQFPASMRIQKPDPNRESKEMLSELRDMLVERLLLYEKKNKVLPERIIVFRDGVSEGQFDIVLREEKAQILEAFQKLSGPEPYRPVFSIVICGKRHHARFYPTHSNFADVKGNTRPGTVVDKGVTAVFDFDFYLQAHAGLQGTVKPTHYTVVYDELNFTADELQQGSNDFSYLYARATKAVSLIPAAYYADLACERGRYYLNDFMVDEKATSSGKGKFDREEERARVFNAARESWGEGIHPDIRDSMFYI
ncbi:argonaute-like protein [Mycena sanguinolenta]|nr:argonaute-like protein [Mycena sanguinolenta]